MTIHERVYLMPLSSLANLLISISRNKPCLLTLLATQNFNILITQQKLRIKNFIMKNVERELKRSFLCFCSPIDGQK